MKAYLELTKPRVTWLILMSAAVGFFLGSAGALDWIRLLHTLAGTALVASGAAALNQWMEREVDARMRRTQDRPLPAGRLEPARAFWFGLGLSVAGVTYLTGMVSPAAGGLAGLTCLSYLLCYTPLKLRSTLCTLVGAFPGAMPILIGFLAARGRMEIEGLVLFGILFLWQFPHFHAIATLYREDYRRAGIVMLPVVDQTGAATARQIVGATAALLVVSAIPGLLGRSSPAYLAAAAALGLSFLYFGLRLAAGRQKMQARRLLQASVFYLPLVYGLLVLNKAAW